MHANIAKLRLLRRNNGVCASIARLRSSVILAWPRLALVGERVAGTSLAAMGSVLSAKTLVISIATNAEELKQ